MRQGTTSYRRGIGQGVVPAGHVIEDLWAISSPYISKLEVHDIIKIKKIIAMANINQYNKSTAVNHAEKSVGTRSIN